MLTAPRPTASAYRASRVVLWRLLSYLAAATVAGIAVVSAPRTQSAGALGAPEHPETVLVA